MCFAADPAVHLAVHIILDGTWRPLPSLFYPCPEISLQWPPGSPILRKIMTSA